MHTSSQKALETNVADSSFNACVDPSATKACVRYKLLTQHKVSNRALARELVPFSWGEDG